MSKLNKRYVVKERVLTGYNAFNQAIYDYKTRKEIDMIVVIKNHTTAGQALENTKVDLLGLTVEKSLKKNQFIYEKEGSEVYKVDFVNNVARLAQITLIKIENE